MSNLRETLNQTFQNAASKLGEVVTNLKHGARQTSDTIEVDRHQAEETVDQSTLKKVGHRVEEATHQTETSVKNIVD